MVQEWLSFLSHVWDVHIEISGSGMVYLVATRSLSRSKVLRLAEHPLNSSNYPSPLALKERDRHLNEVTILPLSITYLIGFIACTRKG